MAVDANIIIFERIKEELRAGRKLSTAFKTGFDQATGTIIDANLTTLAAALFLYFLGSGPIKGFSVTISVGVISSMFSTIIVMRVLLALWINMKKPDSILIRSRIWELSDMALLRFLPDNLIIPFMKGKGIASSFSGILIAGSILFWLFVGLNTGIDFRGGFVIEVKTLEGAANVEALREELSDLKLGDISLQEFGSEREVLIRVQSQG